MGLAKTMLKDGKLVRLDRVGSGWPPDEGINFCDGTFLVEGTAYVWDLVVHKDENGEDVWGLYVIKTGDSGDCRSDVTSLSAESTLRDVMTVLWEMADDIENRGGGR